MCLDWRREQSPGVLQVCDRHHRHNPGHKLDPTVGNARGMNQRIRRDGTLRRTHWFHLTRTLDCFTESIGTPAASRAKAILYTGLVIEPLAGGTLPPSACTVKTLTIGSKRHRPSEPAH